MSGVSKTKKILKKRKTTERTNLQQKTICVYNIFGVYRKVRKVSKVRKILRVAYLNSLISCTRLLICSLV